MDEHSRYVSRRFALLGPCRTSAIRHLKNEERIHTHSISLNCLRADGTAVISVTEEDIVMLIDKPHFKVKLHSAVLEVDLKEGLREELERVLEAKPAIRDSLGFLFQTIVPLDVPLRNIESATVDKKGQVKITIPSRRDITIPLESEESERLVDKLNELIPLEKERAERQRLESEKTRMGLEAGISEAREAAEDAGRLR
jgi:hypothetical protein